ncbi:PTS galactitol transporter subunit IIC, partial [Klebsiella sp. Kps]|nr:PTS galactitol transporter subunit IIC [Klebsiella sp. Kps]
LTNNAWIGLGVVLVLSVIDLIVAQHIAPKWQEYYGLTGTTCSTLSYITSAWPIAIGLNWVIDKIPGVRKIDISMEKFGNRLGFF